MHTVKIEQSALLSYSNFVGLCDYSYNYSSFGECIKCNDVVSAILDMLHVAKT